jgi:riboflavin kinase / FMN adenylyltransferase
MQVYRDIEHLPVFRNAVVTIGTFDGVHLGHQKIIHQLKEEADSINGETVIVSFHPHPRKVIAANKPAIGLLNTLEEKTELLKQYGVDNLVIVPFTDRFANLSAQEYITQFLVEKFNPHTFIIGYDHRFGKDRQGDYHLLEALAAENHYIVKEIPEHVINDVTISSTKIREALLKGHVEEANSYLGYNYFFEGEVVHGDKRGRTIGFPTANIHINDPEKLVPGDGVYAVNAELIGKNYEVRRTKSGILKGMMNIGVRPTVDGTKRMIEVNIFDFDEDIYGKLIRIYLMNFLRGEKKFNGIDELKDQLKRDKETAMKVLNIEHGDEYRTKNKE